MGRIAGVTADETRERVLHGAAAVFARKGYDGASIAEIASEAGVSSGALYAHFGSKAQLFAATLRTHGADELEKLLDFAAGTDFGSMIGPRGVALARRRPEEGSLLAEAIVAAKRHPEVADVLRAAFAEREERFTELLVAGQRAGLVDSRIRPPAVSRFVFMLVLGSLQVAALGLPPVDEDDWSALIADLVSRFNPRPPAT